MSHERPSVGTDGRALPVLPPERDARVWARLVRVMFYTPGFLALLLLKAGEPTAFGVTVELLMLASGAAVVGGLFIGTQSDGKGADANSRIGVWSGALVLELLAVVPFLTALPALFHELAHSTLLHARAPGAATASPGFAELLPAMAILPFMIYQLTGFGTLNFVLTRLYNWVVNAAVLVLIVIAYIANRQGEYLLERVSAGVLMLAMSGLVIFGILKLRRMQADFLRRAPPKAAA